MTIYLIITIKREKILYLLKTQSKSIRIGNDLLIIGVGYNCSCISVVITIEKKFSNNTRQLSNLYRYCTKEKKMLTQREEQRPLPFVERS